MGPFCTSAAWVFSPGFKHIMPKGLPCGTSFWSLIYFGGTRSEQRTTVSFPFCFHFLNSALCSADADDPSLIKWTCCRHQQFSDLVRLVPEVGLVKWRDRCWQSSRVRLWWSPPPGLDLGFSLPLAALGHNHLLGYPEAGYSAFSSPVLISFTIRPICTWLVCFPLKL